jgi:hypothetical protein
MQRTRELETQIFIAEQELRKEMLKLNHAIEESKRAWERAKAVSEELSVLRKEKDDDSLPRNGKRSQRNY